MATAEAASPEGNPPIADGVERRLPPSALAWRRTLGWIHCAVVSLPLLAATAGAAAAWSGSRAALALLVAAAALLWATLAWSAQVWPRLEHRHATYRVDAIGIELRRGVVWRRTINVGRSRVQHTDVSQGPLERRFGLATLHIYTAGTDHAKVDLPGLERATALRIRDHLLPGELDDAV
jgi:uncharacterized protein